MAVDNKQYQLRSGIALHAYKPAIFVFDCEMWPPGKSVTIPSATPCAGGKLPNAYVEADEAALENVVNRTQMLNCFLGCLSTSISSIHKTALWLGQEISPSTYIPFPVPRESLSKLDSVSVETAFCNSGMARAIAEKPRIVFKDETLTTACALLDTILENPVAVRLVDLIYKGAIRYAQHDFSLAAVIGWAVCEKVLNISWAGHLSAIRSEAVTPERMPGDRFRKLTGRDFTASIITEIQELFGLIPNELFEKLNNTRQVRNSWMHELENVSDKEASSALNLAQEMVNRVFNVRLLIQLSHSMRY
jgi:hypothetical protein